MANKDKGFSPPTTGGASLLTVFAVLCLTVFALLSLSTVRADSALSEASAKAVRDYYVADGKAQELLARLRFGELPDEVTVYETIAHYPDRVEEMQICAYTVPISETQELRVEVEVRGTDDYTVLRWQAVPVGDWEIDDDLGLWDGEEFDGGPSFWDGEDIGD